MLRKVVRTHLERGPRAILDNTSSRGTPEVETWLAKHPQVHFHDTPTCASWLNQVEGLFGILGKQALSLTDLLSNQPLREDLAFMRSWNRPPTPLARTNPAAAIIGTHGRTLERIATAVHEL